jgi:hypothetical protein
MPSQVEATLLPYHSAYWHPIICFFPSQSGVSAHPLATPHGGSQMRGHTSHLLPVAISTLGNLFFKVFGDKKPQKHAKNHKKTAKTSELKNLS